VSKKHLILLLSCFCFTTEASAESLTTTTPATQLTTQPTQVISQGLLVETFLTSNWKKDDLTKLLGNSLSTFDDYEAYAAGIKIRWDENNKAYGILVNATYPGEIVKGLTTKTTKNDVTKLLGSPQFVDQSNELVGYQYDGYYLFVTFTQEKNQRDLYLSPGSNK